jgi:adenine-specific DNA methylase
MPIPYMWSKNKSCFQIANIIEAYCPNNDKLLVELFCGWFAVWEVFLKKWYKVIANDKNKYIISLLDKVINGWLDEKKCLEWVSRKLFIDVRDNPNKYEDWYVWYLLQIWSFGNNQKWYLSWEELEIKKHSLYELVVNKKTDDFVQK